MFKKQKPYEYRDKKEISKEMYQVILFLVILFLLFMVGVHFHLSWLSKTLVVFLLIGVCKLIQVILFYIIHD